MVTIVWSFLDFDGDTSKVLATDWFGNATSTAAPCAFLRRYMNTLTTKEVPDGSKINLQDSREAKGAHKLGISQDELRALIEKVGNSAAIVKKRNPG